MIASLGFVVERDRPAATVAADAATAELDGQPQANVL